MKIELTNLGKRYNREWIFRNLSFQFDINKHYAITGPNGSGKSTLLQIIAGSAMYNEGEIAYHHLDKTIEPENIFNLNKLLARLQSFLDTTGGDLKVLGEALQPKLNVIAATLMNFDTGQILDNMLAAVPPDGTITLRVVP